MCQLIVFSYRVPVSLILGKISFSVSSCAFGSRKENERKGRKYDNNNNNNCPVKTPKTHTKKGDQTEEQVGGGIS